MSSTARRFEHELARDAQRTGQRAAGAEQALDQREHGVARGRPGGSSGSSCA
jgi:hypothetical protein